MEYYEKYLAQIEAEDCNPEVLEELYQEAARSLNDDPPERALTMVGQMVGAMLSVARKHEPPQGLIDAVNALTALLADYVECLGWRQRAIKTEVGWIYSKSPFDC